MFDSTVTTIIDKRLSQRSVFDLTLALPRNVIQWDCFSGRVTLAFDL